MALQCSTIFILIYRIRKRKLIKWSFLLAIVCINKNSRVCYESQLTYFPRAWKIIWRKIFILLQYFPFYFIYVLILRRKLIASSILNILSTPNFYLKYYVSTTPAHTKHFYPSPINNDNNILHYPRNIIPPWLNIKLNMDLSLTLFHKFENNSLLFMTHYNRLLK